MDNDDLINLLVEHDDDSLDDNESSDSSSGEQSGNREGSGDNRSQEAGPNVSYDTSLPAMHSYLGNDLEELSGRTVLDDNSYQTIPLLTLPGVVLIPGQILPLQIFNPATVSMMMHIINSDRTFGMINSRFSGRTFGNTVDPIGTTAEIRSFREEGENSYGGNVLRIKAEGRQRFEVLETRRQSDGMTVGKVRILPEIVLGDPGEDSKLGSLDKFRIPPPQLAQPSPSCSGTGNGNNCGYLIHQGHKYNKYDFANYTSVPAFVYKLYDPHILMKKIKTQLQSWNRALKSEYMPCNPREFSYWVAANLPLDDNQRLTLLSIDDVVQRLRQELQILEECSVLRCRDCLIYIANRNDIFSMSLQGPQGTYVNANGYVHEAITVYRVKGLVLTGRPSTEQSWFPGYAWTIAECEHCKHHVGWRFTAVDKKLKPNKFWGLCRSSLQAGLADSNEAVMSADEES